MSNNIFSGQITFRSSRHVMVQAGSDAWQCELRGRLKRENAKAVVGDLVRFLPQSSETGERVGIVEEILPRRNWLSRRREVGGGSELIVAANLDRVMAVFSTQQPRFKFGALDRLLIAADRQELPAVVVVNKLDLGFEKGVEERLSQYSTMGYPVLKVSAETGEGLAELSELLRESATVVSGPSGVGKSSLLSLVLGVPIRVGEVSQHNEKGRHTTTAVTWYPLPTSGAVIDTPGFREYGLWQLEPRELAFHMADFAAHLGGCKFSNCLHLDEPHCTIRDLVEQGELSSERYRSYQGILDSLRNPGKVNRESERERDRPYPE